MDNFIKCFGNIMKWKQLLWELLKLSWHNNKQVEIKYCAEILQSTLLKAKKISSSCLDEIGNLIIGLNNINKSNQ